MSLLRLGATGVHRTGLKTLQETQRSLRGAPGAHTARYHAFKTTPSAGRCSICTGASHHHQ
ncbi:MAG TPA: hypothetical protein VKA15_11625 [Isosphaeraceae bacterium]|nr:hypothetical protein [Isosphaeraceae bacterium]